MTGWEDRDKKQHGARLHRNWVLFLFKGVFGLGVLGILAMVWVLYHLLAQLGYCERGFF